MLVENNWFWSRTMPVIQNNMRMILSVHVFLASRWKPNSIKFECCSTAADLIYIFNIAFWFYLHYIAAFSWSINACIYVLKPGYLLVLILRVKIDIPQVALVLWLLFVVHEFLSFYPLNLQSREYIHHDQYSDKYTQQYIFLASGVLDRVSIDLDRRYYSIRNVRLVHARTSCIIT